MAKLKAPKFQSYEDVVANSSTPNINTTVNTNVSPSININDPYSIGAAYAKIAQLSKTDKAKGLEAWNYLRDLQNDPNSRYYSHYSRPTNQAVAKLQSYGIDTSKLTDEWFAKNDNWIRSNLEYRSNLTNAPSAPTKNSTKNQRIAYELYQYKMAEEQTRKAESEYDKAIDTAVQYALWTDRNYSDDEIIKKVRENFAKDYPTLAAMEDPGFNLMELNRGIDFSDDVLRAYIWSARNPNQKVSLEAAMANSYLGNGNQWQEDPTKTAKLTLGSAEYNPYDVGSTMEKERLYFGMNWFDQEWLDENYERYYVNGTEEQKAMYKSVWDAEETTKSAENAVKALELWKNQLKTTDPVKAQQKLDDVLAGGKLWIKTDKNGNQKIYTTKVTASNGSTVEEVSLNVLNKMDKSVGKGDQKATGDLLDMNRRVSYKYGEFVSGLAEQCEKNKGKKTDADDMNDILDGITKKENPSLNDVFNMMNSQETPAESETQEPVPVENETETVKAPETPEEIPQEQAPKTDLFPKYTDAEKEDIQIKNEKISDAAETLGSVLSENEETVMNNAGSVLFYENKDRYTALMSDEEASSIFNDTAVQASIGDVISTGFDTLHDIEVYSRTESNLAADKAAYEQYKEKYGDVEYLTKEFKPQTTIQVGDFVVSLSYQDNGDGKQGYVITDINSPSRNLVYDEIVDYGLEEDIVNQANPLIAEETKEAIKILATQNMVERYGKEGAAEIEAYKALVPKIANEEQYLAENKETYDQETARMRDSLDQLYNMYEAAEILGRDTTEITKAIDYMEGMVNYYYEPSLPVQDASKLETINKICEAYGIEYTDEQKSKMMHGSIDKINAEIQDINDKFAYAEEHGITVPDKYARNMQLKLEDLEAEKKAYEYSILLTDTDPQEIDKAVAAGKAFEEKYGEGNMHYWANLFSQDGFYTLHNQTWYNEGLGKDVVTPEDEKTYYYLLGKNILAMGDSLDEAISRINTNPDETQQALINAYKDAIEYQEFMTNEDSGFGVWRNKEYDISAGLGKEMVDSDAVSGTVANVASTLVTPAESVASLVYTLDRALSGKRFNPKSSARRVSGFKENTRTETFESIDEAFKDNPVAKTIARLGYEIYVNRGDSLMNSIAFGSLLPGEGAFGGKFANMLNEFAGASPMGITAGLNAAIEAVTNGANTDQAWLLLGATFAAETITEAVTYSNLREAMGTTENLSAESLKGFFKDWLTKNGLEEAFGESANDLIENFANSAVANYKENPNFESDHQKLVDYYMSQGFTGEGEAEAKATEQELKGIVHTAIVSYLSAGTDVMLKTGKAVVNTVQDVLSGYRGYTKMRQKAGYNESMVDYMVRDAKKALGKDDANAKKAATAASAVTVAKSNGVTSQTEMMASILDNGNGDGDASDQASAAAAFMQNVLGERAPAIVQEVMIGAAKANVSVEDVTLAMQNAALGDGAASRMVQTDTFRNATPEDKAKLLALTIKEDQNNPEVQQNIAAKVKDFRTTMQMNDLAAEGHFDQAQADQNAAVEAAKNTAAAQEEADARSDAAQQANTAAVEANNLVAENPTPDNLKEQTQALDKVQATEEVEKQSRQHLEKMQKAQQEAEAKAEKSAKDAYDSAKQIAEQRNTETDQQRAADREARAEQQRIATEQQAEAKRQQMIEDQRSGKLAEEKAQSEFQRIAQERGLTGPDAETFVNDMMDSYRSFKLGNIDMENQFTDAEAALMMGNLERRFGVKIQFADMENGENGFYDPSTNTITLNRNLRAGQAMLEFAMHELTHALESSNSYGKYHDAVMKAMYKTDASKREAVAAKMAEREAAGHPISEAQAERELVAEFTRTKLNDKDTVSRIVDAGLGGKFRNFLHNINQFLKNLRLSGDERTAAEDLRKAENLFIKALNSKKNNQENTNTEIEYSTEKKNGMTDAEKLKTMLDAGVITQADIDAYQQKTSRPQEGKSAKWSQSEGPAQRQFGKGMLQDSDEIAQQAKDYALAHNAMFPDTNADQIERAINWIRKNGSQKDENGNWVQKTDGYNESLAKVTDKSFNYSTADGQARMIATMAMAVARNDVAAQVQLADAFNRQGTDLGRALQARKLFRMMTPEGRIASIQKMMENSQDELNAKGIKVELKFSDWVYRAASLAQSEADFNQVKLAAAAELANQIPATWRDKLRSFRMLSMLANPRTHIRNVIGNALFVPVVSLKNKLGAIAELGVKKGEKTKSLNPFSSKEVRQFAREDAVTMKDTLTGEAKYNENSLVKRQQKAFGGLLQAVIDFNGNALESEDWIFLKGHYRRALGSWMQANGYTVEQMKSNPSLLEQGRAYAIQEAQKATYRDFNKLADTLNKVSREGGVAGFLTDAVLPFKKTPANILRRGIEYSPVGLIRSLTSDLYHLKEWNDYNKGKTKALPEKALSPTQFIDRACSGLSGSMVMAVGAILASSGIVSCGLGDDEDEFEKAKGNQKYAFKINIGGQDFTYTVDWAAPMSMPFFVGAAIYEQLGDGFDINEIVNAFGNITEPVFNLSMLDGVNTLFKTSQYDDTNTLTQIGAKIGSNYVTSYVPSLLGAIARTYDDKQRKAFVESGKGTGVSGTIRYAIEQVENKIPGVSQSNIPTRDIWGEEKTSSLAERIFENWISPGYIEKYNEDPIINEMGRLFDATGDKSMIPDADPDKSITYDKKKYVLTAEQWDQYKATRNQTAHKELAELIDREDYKQANDAAKVQMIKDIWSYADKVGRSEVIPDYAFEGKGEDVVGTIAKEAKITSYKNDMMKALETQDFDGYDAIVEALTEEGVEESEIRNKIATKYRDLYKKAYLNNDERTMSEIEDLLDNTGFGFDFGAWESQVDEKYGL